MLNERLFSLYHNHMQALDALYADLDAKCVEDYAGPLLPYCWEELYLRSQHRLVMIGQETNGWYCDYMKSDGEIRKNIEVYKNFQLGAECNSTFWLYAHRFNLELNGFDDLNFIWMNVNKFGRNTGKGKPEQVVLDDEVHYYNLLAEELEILQPDVCLFFTGPNYDEDIRLKISDIEYHEFAGYSVRNVARLRSKHLPKHSYRTHHPGYGNRISETYIGILNAILQDCKR